MNSIVEKVTKLITERSRPFRQAYLDRIEQARQQGPHRAELDFANLAHALAACDHACKVTLNAHDKPDIGIISSYSDMLSAHEPYYRVPEIIKEEVAGAGGVAQFAGGVPAMCDGVTQGRAGMELSLMSRDVIAMSTAVGLSHNMFDGALMLGVCDKIVPGLLMGALSFGHLPAVFVPAGPMPSGIPNKEKAHARELFSQGKISSDEMLATEEKAYHSAGTCTFYGTANSNQLLVEMMGLHLPGASFVNPGTPLRDELTRAAARQVVNLTDLGDNYTPIGHVINEKSIVNAIVALLATSGSTNQTLHLVAVARAAGLRINWDDFSQLSDVVPLIVRIYPSGPEDINSFQQAGGMAVLINELLKGGFLHDDVLTVCGQGLAPYTETPYLKDGGLVWRKGPETSSDKEVIAGIASPFSPTGGIEVLSGNLGRAVMKTSALANDRYTVVEAPAVVFDSQYGVSEAFGTGKLDRDCVVVVRFEGPRADGMPELHKLIPFLSILIDRGFNVALVTDGRMSGASGKVPSAIHVTPEAFANGLLAKVLDGDIIRVDAEKGFLELKVSEEELAGREPARPSLEAHRHGMGR
ncbi:MAG: phosphogluconate dehydratase, partial [Deltaproteobacteria bacterium]|nr:phosphogluconate dehydratase [Deltaproteobacteria bacterium]